MRRKISILSFILVSIALIIGLYFLFIRTNLHHTIFDGFYNTLIHTNTVPTTDGSFYRQTYIDWPNVKLFLILFALIIVFVVSLTSYIIHRIQINKKYAAVSWKDRPLLF